jgi:2-polyprenyl-3-methyl-5-hydroxy-6-metoxy-1,4-benzoquinol methylase
MKKAIRVTQGRAVKAPASDHVMTMDEHTYRSAYEFAGYVRGTREDRLSGLHDLLCCAQGASVLDIGINHGLISFEFACRGASLVHGCDIHKQGVDTAREIFAEIRAPSRFEVVDLTAGPAILEEAFAPDYRSRYDIVLFLGIYHLLKQQTCNRMVEDLVHHLVDRTQRFLVTRTRMLAELQTILAGTGLKKVHYSALSSVVSPVEIWSRR